MRPLIALCASVTALAACRDATAPTIRLRVGPAAADTIEFAPRSALAEYVEPKPGLAELVVTLSSQERRCDDVALAPDAASVTVRITYPDVKAAAPGSVALAATPSAEQPSAMATARLHGRRFELSPGGSIDVQELELTPRGRVTGLLKFESSGDANHPETLLTGAFTAHFCRVSRLGQSE